jgi:radical SAM protein with 4Fe4S-binding SPASM domain
MIRHINIDPNGLCNAKCWFCPVAYAGNPKENISNMSLETIEDIFIQLRNGVGDFVDPDYQIVNNPIHFNEILLYPHFEEMLELHRKYNIKIVIFTNGVNLTKNKTDILAKYSDIIIQIILNIPSAKAEQWSEFTGFNVKLFDKMVNNLKYAEQKIDWLYESGNFKLQVNGYDETSLEENGGWVKILDKAPVYNLDPDSGTFRQIVDEMKNLFPKFAIIEQLRLSDRTQHLEKSNVLSNQDVMRNDPTPRKVVGCRWKYPDHHLFISSVGNVYLCCADFGYETVYANIHEKSLKEIWQGQDRKNLIKDSYDNFCTKCLQAVWEKI